MGKENTDIILLDTETTGLDPNQNEVAQIAFLILDGDTLEETSSYASYLRCDMEFYSDVALKINGLEVDFLKNEAPPAHIALGVLGQYSKLDVLGHNVLFDLQFLDGAYRRHRLPTTRWYRKHCTMAIAHTLARAGHIKPKNFKLDTLAAYFGCPGRSGDKHDALEDVRVTADLYRALIKIMTPMDVRVEAAG